MEVVNGYVCKNCTDVELAKKGVDPARPKGGPEGVYAADRGEKADKAADAKQPQAADPKPQFGPAVTFSGALANVTPASPVEKAQPYSPGATVNISA